MSLGEKKLFLLDMDGTIYLSERLFDGAADFLRTVKALGGRVSANVANGRFTVRIVF